MGFFFGHEDEEEDEVPEWEDRRFAEQIGRLLAGGDRRERYQREEQEEEEEPWSVPLRRWAEGLDRSGTAQRRRNRRQVGLPEEEPAERPSPRMRQRRRLPDADDDIVIIRRPAPKLVPFPSPDRAIRKVCRDYLRRSTMIGKYPRVLIDED